MYGAGLGAAPDWCPPTSYSRDEPRRDPCEVTYKFNLPVIGEREVAVPVNQIVNDIWLHVQSILPEIVDKSWEEAQPKINQLVAGVERDLEYFVPELVDEVMQEQILPELERQLTIVFAKVDVMKDQAIQSAWGIGLLLTAAVGTAAWWVRS